MSKLTSNDIQTLFGALHSATYKTIEDGYYHTAKQDIELLERLVPKLDSKLRADYTDFVSDILMTLLQAKHLKADLEALRAGR